MKKRPLLSAVRPPKWWEMAECFSMIAINPVIPGQPDYVALEDGERYDLSQREPIVPQDAVEIGR